MVNRGTSDFKDVMTDAKLLFCYNKRFNEPKKILGKNKQNYTDQNIDVIGHSFGAKIAETLGDDPQVKNIITLNKPNTPKGLIQKTKINNKQFDIRTTGDLVNVLQPLQTGQNIVIISETKTPYTEHKIDVYDRLDKKLVIGTGLKGKKSFEKYFNNLVGTYIKRVDRRPNSSGVFGWFGDEGHGSLYGLNELTKNDHEQFSA